MGTFGTKKNPQQFIEIPDTTYVDPDYDYVSPPPGSQPKTRMVRPPAGTVVKVKDALTLADLPDLVAGQYGYFADFTAAGVDQILVSGDNGATWVGPLLSAEATGAGATAGATAATALSTATAADSKASQALQLAQAAGKVTIEDVTGSTFTLAQIHARDDRQQIPVAEVSGAASTWDDIAPSAPAFPVLGADNKIPASYLPSGGTGSGYRIYQNADGTYPARTTVTSDPTVVVTYVMQYDVTKEPTIGPDTATAYAQDLTATPQIPGDEIQPRLPL